MMFDEVPPCRSTKHRKQGVLAKYRIEHPVHGTTYRCWECLCKEQYDTKQYDVTPIRDTRHAEAAIRILKGEHTS